MYIGHADGETGATLLEASLGTTDWQFAEALAGQLAQLANVGGEVNDVKFQQAMALAQGVQPKDEVEAMLATQMAAVHLATMEYAGRLHRSTSVQISETYERSLTRLSRTFAAQVDALKKYRSKGEQRVVVEHQHVHVYPGGQAVVSEPTIKRLEASGGDLGGRADTGAAIVAAVQAAGVQFIPENGGGVGVRLVRPTR